MTDYSINIKETKVRLGEVRFSYVNVFKPRRNDDGTTGKYSVQLLIPKENKNALELIESAIAAAKQKGVASKWNGKMPPSSKLHTPLRDGDDEHPGEPEYEGMYFMNTSTDTKPEVYINEGGKRVTALDSDDVYSGCYGAVTVNFYPYNNSGNVGISAGLNRVVKMRDGERLGGDGSADEDFGDLFDSAASFLD